VYVMVMRFSRLFSRRILEYELDSNQNVYIPRFAPVMAMTLPSSCTVLTGFELDVDAIVL
jgi:hypothetical protein